MEPSSDRSAFVRRLLQALSEGRYALLKFTSASLDEIEPSSDVDVLVERERVDALLRWMQKDPAVERLRPLRRSFMVMVRVFLRDGGYVQIDLIHAFARKSLQYLDAAAMLAGVRPSPGEGLSIPSLQEDFAYPFLFSLLNRASLPQKHRRHFDGLDPAGRAKLLEGLNRTYGLEATSLSDLFTYSPARRRKVLRALRARPENRMLRRARRFVEYARDTVSRERGLVITFSGVDGGGKSTVLEAVRAELEQRYRQTVRVLRHRPSLLPILSAFVHGKKGAEERSTSKLPRTGTNRSTAGSLLRFSYYLLDYGIGQFVVYLRHTSRGEVVLYDRYYFDFIVDPRRTNLQLEAGFTRFFYRFLLEPDLNFLLVAAPDVILARKSELPRDVIEELTRGYQGLFERLRGSSRGDGNRYHTIENVDLGATTRRIQQVIRERV